jgi:hypothetical protein
MNFFDHFLDYFLIEEFLIILKGKRVMFIYYDRGYAIYSLLYSERFEVYQVFIFINTVSALRFKFNILI